MKVTDITNGEAIQIRSKLTMFRLSIDDIEQTLRSEHRDLREIDEILDDIIERANRFKSFIGDIEKEAEEW